MIGLRNRNSADQSNGWWERPTLDRIVRRVGEDQIQDLRDNALRCRRLASVVVDEVTRKMLLDLAVQFDRQAEDFARAGVGVDEEGAHRNED